MNRFSSFINSKKRKTVASDNARILRLAEEVSVAFEEEVEDILADAESAVSEVVPKVQVASALRRLEKLLDREGLEVGFDPALTKFVRRPKTASNAGLLSEAELNATVAQLRDEIVAMVEKAAEDAEVVAETLPDEEFNELSEEDLLEVDAKLKSVLERKMYAKGVNVRFARSAAKKTASKTAKKPAKK